MKQDPFGPFEFGTTPIQCEHCGEDLKTRYEYGRLKISPCECIVIEAKKEANEADDRCSYADQCCHFERI